MSVAEKKAKREKATYKLGNQLSVLSRTALKKDAKAIKEMVRLYATLSQ